LASVRVWEIRHAYLAWFVLHFLLITAVSCHETFRLAAHDQTILARKNDVHSLKVESVGAGILGLHLPESNRLRQTLATYLGLAGIDAGYGYFAPNVPDTYQLVFELHYADGDTENLPASVTSGAAGLRLASFLDQIGRTPSAAFREHMIKKLAAVVWRRHPEAVTMRASLAQMVQPTIGEYKRGKRETSALLYVYDFSLAPETAPEPKR
jgi:hypothetical protein